jgi:hypothetical protein
VVVGLQFESFGINGTSLVADSTFFQTFKQNNFIWLSCFWTTKALKKGEAG